MKPAVPAIAAWVLLGLTACSQEVTGDPAKGAELHDDCFGCHRTEVYVPPRAKVKTLAELREEVERWNDRMNPKFDRQEVEDVVAYLNRDFYKLPP